MKMAIPKVPILFSKPSTALAGPHPDLVILPKAFIKDESADYEAELGVILGRDTKNVSEEEAMDYVLGCVLSCPWCTREAEGQIHCCERRIESRSAVRDLSMGFQ